MPSYNPVQTRFILSMASNLGRDMEVRSIPTFENELLNLIRSSLGGYKDGIGDWDIVWGPAVFKDVLSTYADNVMMVAKGTANSSLPGQLVVAVAGTNMDSWYDWLVEDLWVFQTTPWPTTNPNPGTHACISKGTADGLSHLLKLIPSPGMPGSGYDLKDFLGATAASLLAPTVITVTGHSLGGALSPVLALHLEETQATWDPSGKIILGCMASAGPTPGNSDFAQYYDRTAVGRATSRQCNAMDLVPHAWAQSTLKEVSTLYVPEIRQNWEIDALVDVLKFLASGKDYAPICANAPPLLGTINQAAIDRSSSILDQFVAQVSYQHVYAYFDLLKVMAPLAPPSPLSPDVASRRTAKLRQLIQTTSVGRKANPSAVG